MIPRILHRIWLDEPIPELFESWWARFEELHPGWELRTWNISAGIDWLVNQQAFEDALAAEGSWSYGFRSDILRYEVLRRFGGVYVDTDVEPLRSFDPLLEDPRPFVAWCSENELDPSIIASPTGHPAIEALVARIEGRTGSPPARTGPTFVTGEWRHRDDVRRLPPITFFPYHWRNQERQIRALGGRYPDETYAVHHWNAGWKAPKTPRAPSAAPVPFSILVAFREDSRGRRTPLWELIRAKLAAAFPEAEIVVGTNEDIPFNKARALNSAATQASHEIFVITDTDTWTAPDDIRAAVAMVASGEAPWVKPWRYKTKLCEADTAAVLQLGAGWDGTIDPAIRRRAEMRTSWWSSPPCVLPRSAFETVNGLDERFAGWGQEDDAFGHALECLVGHRRVTAGTADAIHLFHPRHGKSGHDAWDGGELGANRDRGRAYRQALKKPAVMKKLIEGNRSALVASGP